MKVFVINFLVELHRDDRMDSVGGITTQASCYELSRLPVKPDRQEWTHFPRQAALQVQSL
jgi:hypothetical protein